MSENSTFFKGIAVMALLALLVGFIAIIGTPKGNSQPYTAMYMNTSAIDRNITNNHTSIVIPFSVENQEGKAMNYRYSVSILFKDTIFHSGIDAWSEDLNTDEKHNVTSGSFSEDNGAIKTINCTVPVKSTQKWKNANVTIELYKDGSADVYRTLRLWAVNQSTQ